MWINICCPFITTFVTYIITLDNILWSNWQCTSQTPCPETQSGKKHNDLKSGTT